MTDKLTPQLRKILAHVERAGHITARAALIDHGIAALPRRIADLKELGYKIRKEFTTNPATGQKYMRYFITKGLKFKVGDLVGVTHASEKSGWRRVTVAKINEGANYPLQVRGPKGYVMNFREDELFHVV